MITIPRLFFDLLLFLRCGGDLLLLPMFLNRCCFPDPPPPPPAPPLFLFTALIAVLIVVLVMLGGDVSVTPILGVLSIGCNRPAKVRSTFHFDDVLTSFSSQEDVFRATLQLLVGQAWSFRGLRLSSWSFAALAAALDLHAFGFGAGVEDVERRRRLRSLWMLL